MYRTIAAELRALGIDGNCAPLGDIARSGTHAVLRNRCYGTDARTVATNARAVSDALLAGGVLPVLKHIPGHGRARADSHLELPRVTAELDALVASDFSVFRALNDIPLGMTAHVVYTALSALPATLSPEAVALIRGEIGFDGLLMTDDIAMGALPGPIGERAARALAAGCDVVLHCNGARAEMEAVAATGPMTPAAARRAQAAIAARCDPPFVDIEAARAEFDAICRSPQ
jgi:beta-N-acetylhexosaminidase